MRITRTEAINLIEERISKFQRILKEANYDNRYDREYEQTCNKTMELLSDLFSEAEARRFRGAELPEFPPVDREEMLQKYKKKIIQYIAKLGNYKDRIQYFWFDDDFGEDKKTVEKALLLMRFYSKQEIHQIGRNMKLQYFDQPGHRAISHYGATLEISKRTTDEGILRLLEENPKGSLSLGGFQGDFYTATEDGEFELASSWGDVRSRIQLTLRKWDKKAYGVLRAIVNKLGTATDDDIADEIERIIGPGYSWSNLLPRLIQQKLVFKAYCSGDPCWEMPEEIIPVVQEQLSAYESSIGEIHEENVPGSFGHDVAISFAGEDRRIAKQLADALEAKGIRTFYDEFYKHDLWGKKLTRYFRNAYGVETRFVIILISEHYPIKDWTDFEYSIARAEAEKRQTEFILPVRIDDTRILGIHEDVGYLDYRKEGIDGIVNTLLRKLGRAVDKKLEPNEET